MRGTEGIVRRTAPALPAAAAFAFIALATAPAAAAGDCNARSCEGVLSAAVSGKKTFSLPRPATHVALHWRGHPHARLRAAFSRSAEGPFGRARRVRLDELTPPGEETYGAVMVARGAERVRVRTDRPLSRVTVLPLRNRGPSGAAASTVTGDSTSVATSSTTAAGVQQPPIISRAGWGANESLRFDSSGTETWPPTFWPIQKLIVHHTATQNNDPDPVATMRSIYYYHAITQGWGDIGYNFVIDEAGNIYEGRYSGEYPTGQDINGNGVTAGHAKGYNAGTVGVALLGTLSTRDATPAAREALEALLAWEADDNGIDPQGSSPYVNPASGTQATFANISGHRDVAATECPGGSFYGTFADLRSEVAATISAAHSGTSKTYQPAGYTILSGSVYRDRGALSRLYYDDGTRLEIRAAKNDTQYTSDLYAYTRISAEERQALNRLTIQYDGNASASDAALSLSIYDWSAGAWVKIDGPRTGVTSDRAFTWYTTVNPQSYVSTGGEVRMRIKGTHASGFRTRTDLVRFSIE